MNKISFRLEEPLYYNIMKAGLSLFYLTIGSPIRALMSVYPDSDWEPWKFSKLTKTFWKESKNQNNFVNSLAKKLNIKNWEDWYGGSICVLIVEGI